MSTEQNIAPDNNESSESNNKRRPRGRKPRSRQPNRRNDKPQVEPSSDWSLDHFVVAAQEGKSRFHDFNLPDQLMRAIADLGYQFATPIQAATIKPALEGKDIIGKAQTGTGKTAAFLIGIITDLLDFKLEDEPGLSEPRALIIAPTRELALQIASDAEGLVKYTDLRVVSLVGGMDYEVQRKALAEGPVDIMVATPGRLIDFVRNKEVDLFNVEVLVLDEADRMLSMGFIPDVRTIIRSTPRKGSDRQTLLYSATFTEEIMRLAAQWTRDPVTVEIESDNKTTDNVSQTVFLVSSDQKYNLLRNYLRVKGIERAIVFCNRRHQTRDLADQLSKDGVKAAMMSGEIPQHKRIKTLENFRTGKIQVLVATDVAGRGIHIDGVDLVVNYQLPEDSDDYVHRIGRTGRAGASGSSICFACEDDSFLIPDIESQTGVKLDCVHPDAELLAEIIDTPADFANESTVSEQTPEVAGELAQATDAANPAEVTQVAEVAEVAEVSSDSKSINTELSPAGHSAVQETITLEPSIDAPLNAEPEVEVPAQDMSVSEAPLVEETLIEAQGVEALASNASIPERSDPPVAQSDDTADVVEQTPAASEAESDVEKPAKGS